MGVLGGIGMGIDVLTRVLNSAKSGEVADELNSMHREGYRDLKELGPKTRDDLMANAMSTGDQLRGDVLKGTAGRLGNANNLSQSIFGTNTDNMKLGEGGNTAQVKSEGGKYMTDLQDTIAQNFVQNNAMLKATEAGVRHDFDDIKVRAVQGTAEVHNFISDQLGNFEDGVSEAINNVRDMSGRATMAVAQPALTAMSQEVSNLEAQKTGDPAQDAQIDNQVRAIKQGYTAQAQNAVQGAAESFRNYSSGMRKDFSAQRADLAKSAMESYRMANKDEHDSINEGFRTYADVIKTTTALKAANSETATNLYAQGLANVFGATTQALALDSNMIAGISEMVDNTISQTTSDSIAVNSAVSQMVSNAILTGSSIEGQGAMALINASLEFAPLDFGGETIMQYGITRQQMDIQRQQIAAQNRATTTNTILGAGGIVASAGTGIYGANTIAGALSKSRAATPPINPSDGR